MLDTDIRLRAVRRNELRVGANDRLRNSRKRNNSATTSGCAEDGGCVYISSNLLECPHAVLLDRAVEKCQRQPIIEQPKASAHNPFFRGTPSQAETRTEVVLVGTK